MLPATMKKTLFCLTLLLSGAVHADALSDAHALYAKKSYAQAIGAYTKLANAGNADAQYRLAEIHAGSDAGAADPVKAEAWLRKAAAKGHKEAVAKLERQQQRASKLDDIAYWTSKYDGAEFRSGQYSCPPPRFPSVSKLNDEIDAVSKRMTNWENCFNAAANNLNAAAPLSKKLPAEVAAVMSKEEIEKANAHLMSVQAQLAADAKIASQMALADYAVWREATNKWVNEHNRMVKEIKPEPKD